MKHNFALSMAEVRGIMSLQNNWRNKTNRPKKLNNSCGEKKTDITLGVKRGVLFRERTSLCLAKPVINRLYWV